MNFSSFTKIALATIAVSFTSSLANADVCPRLNDAVDLSRLSVDPNGKDYNCNYTPDGMRLKLYKIMLCEQLPNVANYNTTCKPLVDFASGKDVEITADGTSPILDGDVSLSEGTYTHAVIVISNRITSKFTQNFTQPIQGKDGIGTTCWSNGNPAAISYEAYANGPGDYTKFSATCGTAQEADPRWSYYTYKGLWNPRNPGPGHSDPSNPANIFYINSTPWLSYTGNGKDVHLLSDFNTLASVTSGDGGRNLDDENGIVTDAQYLMGVTRFTTPANINPNTENIDLGFKLKNTFFQKITTNNDYYGAKRCSETHGILGESTLTGAHACLSTSYATTFDFRFVVK